MKTLDDIYCRYAGCASASFGINSTSTPTATMRTLQSIYDATYYFYSLQKNQVYDDLNCANNDGEASTTCAAGDAEYTGEESQWSSSTDPALAGTLVATGKVYRDLRTGLYWADSYDTVSNNNTPDTLTNSFTIGTGCTDADINNGTCLQDNYQVKGNAIQYCLNLSLDATGDGTDETDWYLPSQKELMQAYLDGANNNFPHANYWYGSSTEYYSITGNAWSIGPYYGITDYVAESNGHYVRCVRR